MSTPIYAHERELAAMPAKITEFERQALKGIVLVRLHELPELAAAPRQFLDTWLPMIVGGAVHGFADRIEDTEPNALAAVQRFHYHQLIAEGGMHGIANSTRIWMEANCP